MGVWRTKNAPNLKGGINNLYHIVKTGIKGWLARELAYACFDSLLLRGTAPAGPDGPVVQNVIFIAETGRPTHEIHCSQDVFQSSSHFEKLLNPLGLNHGSDLPHPGINVHCCVQAVSFLHPAEPQAIQRHPVSGIHLYQVNECLFWQFFQFLQNGIVHSLLLCDRKRDMFEGITLPVYVFL